MNTFSKLSHVLAFGIGLLISSPSHAHEDDKDYFQVMCEEASWETFAPDRGLFVIAEGSVGRFMFTDFEWDTWNKVSWYGHQQHSTLEIEAIIDGYATEVDSLLDYPDAPQYQKFSRIPCAYRDTSIFDKVTNVGSGSACAGFFQPDQLYYTYLLLGTDFNMSADFPTVNEFRFQRGRWAGDWFEDLLVPNLGVAEACENDAQTSYDTQLSTWGAEYCIFSCHTHDNSQDYRVITSDSGPFSLPRCLTWEFGNPEADLHSCVETSCGDARDNDYDGLFDCDDPDCDAYSVCHDCIYWIPDDGNECPEYSFADGSGPGGGKVFEVCGTAVSDTGHMTLEARKDGGGIFGDRPYHVRVSGADDEECHPGKFKKYDDVLPSGVGSPQLTFEFDSIWLVDQDAKGYCVTASTKPGDLGYDPNNPEQSSWWWSEKVYLHQSCF